MNKAIFAQASTGKFKAIRGQRSDIGNQRSERSEVGSSRDHSLRIGSGEELISGDCFLWLWGWKRLEQRGESYWKKIDIFVGKSATAPALIDAYKKSA